jgi:hypothetical protein
VLHGDPNERKVENNGEKQKDYPDNTGRDRIECDLPKRGRTSGQRQELNDKKRIEDPEIYQLNEKDQTDQNRDHAHYYKSRLGITDQIYGQGQKRRRTQRESDGVYTERVADQNRKNDFTIKNIEKQPAQRGSNLKDTKRFYTVGFHPIDLDRFGFTHSLSYDGRNNQEFSRPTIFRKTSTNTDSPIGFMR